jgi:hypothetical protein
MKIEPRRAPPTEEAAHQEDTTTKFEAEPKRTAHRRTTVTVERETLSFLIRRTVANPGDLSDPLDGKTTPKPSDTILPGEGKP